MYNVPSGQQATPRSPHESTSASAIALAALSQYQPPRYAGHYAPPMNDPSQSSSQAIYHQPTYSAQAGSELETAYNQYQMGLKRLFQHVRDEQLSETGTLLINISNWLLNNVEPLGLVLDDESVHPERLQLWENFNTCWLSTLQKQKEVTQTIVDSGQKLPKSLITHDKLDTMGKELVRLCDLIEKHGLVDYQMGVWEEEIIAMLNNCLDLLGKVPGTTGSA